MQIGLAQSPLDTRLDFLVSEVNLSTALSQLSEASGVSISFSNRFFSSQKLVQFQFEQTPLKEILQKMLATTSVEYQLIGKQIILRKKISQRKYTLSGFIQSVQDGEKLIAATIFSPDHQAGTISNEYGFFSLTLPEGPTQLVCSYLGSEEKILDLNLDKSQQLKIELEQSITLAEVIVSPQEKNGPQIFSTSASASEVSINQLERVPDLGGEPDLLRIAQLLPGVQTGADGLGGLHIRGGNADQNTILLDGVTIYNPSHLLGVFSIFNTSVIRDAKLIKGNFPARYGGRLSSVFDVRTREGNEKKWVGALHSGLVSSKISLEGPILKKKGAILLTARHSHSNFLFDDITRAAFFPLADGFLNYSFHDFNLKTNYSFSSKDRIFLSLYKGGDTFQLQEGEEIEDFGFYAFSGTENRLTWGNLIGSFRWNHQFGDKLFANTTLTYNDYQYKNTYLDEMLEGYSFDELTSENYLYYDLNSAINDLAAQIDFNYIPTPQQYWRYGLGFTRHSLAPGSFYIEGQGEDVLPDADSIDIELLDAFYETNTTRVFGMNAYAENEFSINSQWQINAGLRFSGFIGEETNYFHLEPRLGIRFQVNEQWSLHTGLSKMTQYLHQISNSGINQPEDLWLASSDVLQPQVSWQTGLSVQYTSRQNLDLQLESYVKRMHHLPSLDDTLLINPVLNSDFIEEYLYFGTGLAYGLELLIKKDFGKTGGHLSYSLARSTRYFPDLNLGNEFPFLYDRRHQISLFLFHKFNEHLEFSTSFQYGSSNPQLAIDENLGFGLYALPIINPDGSKNRARSIPYHRLDLSLRYQLSTPRFQHRFKVGVYNAYNQANEAFQRLNYNPDLGMEELNSISFLPVLPSLSYSLQF